MLTQPRQSMFVNRANAIKVLVQYCNGIFVKASFARNSNNDKLLSSENIPTVNSGEYNVSVDTLAERDYLNTLILNTGYKVLVLEDEDNNNYWTVYTLQADKFGYYPIYKDIILQTIGHIQPTIKQDMMQLQFNIKKYKRTKILLTLTTAVEGDIAKVVSKMMKVILVCTNCKVMVHGKKLL